MAGRLMTGRNRTCSVHGTEMYPYLGFNAHEPTYHCKVCDEGTDVGGFEAYLQLCLGDTPMSGRVLASFSEKGELRESISFYPNTCVVNSVHVYRLDGVLLYVLRLPNCMKVIESAGVTLTEFYITTVGRIGA